MGEVQGREEATLASKGSHPLEGGVARTPKISPSAGPSSAYEGIKGKRISRARAPALTHPLRPAGREDPPTPKTPSKSSVASVCQ